MGELPGAGFDSRRSPWGLVVLTALGVLVTVTAAFVAAFHAGLPASEESPMRMSHRYSKHLLSVLLGTLNFASGVVASVVATVCLSP